MVDLKGLGPTVGKEIFSHSHRNSHVANHDM
jgi:hypothetical protein